MADDERAGPSWKVRLPANGTLAAIVVAIGQTRGKTLLALPPGEMLSSGGAGGAGGASKDRQDKDRVHTLESTPVSTRTKKFQPKAR